MRQRIPLARPRGAHWLGRCQRARHRASRALAAAGVLLAAAWVAFPHLAIAGANLWTQDAGPYGGRILCLRAHPNSPSRLFAGTESGGLYVSTDAGATWQSRSAGLELLTVNDVLAVPVGTNTIYAATAGGVFRSGNLGQSWSARNDGLTSLLANSLAMHPTSLARMLCGTADGLFQTGDAGVTWTLASAGLTSTDIAEIVWDSGGNTIYACTGDGVFLNTDPLGTWLPRSNGLSGLARFTRQLVVSPVASAELFLASYGGVFHSLTGGGSWDPINDGLTDTRAQALWIDPGDATHLAVGTEGGVFETHDSGAHWLPLAAGLGETVVRSLAWDGSSLLCGSFYRGVHRWQTSAWTALDQGLANTFLEEIAVDASGNVVSAGGYGGIYQSANAGGSFLLAQDGISVADVRTVCLNPTDPQVIYAGANYGGVYKSTDGGAHFTLVGLSGETVHVLRLLPGNPQVVYAGTYDGVFRSDNGGGLWVARSSGLGNDNVNDLEFDPSNAQVIYAGTYLGHVYKTVDGGLSWTQKASGLGANIVFDVAIDPLHPQVLLAGGFEGKGMWRSTNGGDLWQDVSAGLPNRSIWGVTFDPFDPTRAYAATQNGVARSFDGGVTWHDLSAGLLVKDVRDVRVDPVSFRTLRAATYGGGLYAYSDQVTATPPAPDLAAALAPAYPNPFNPSTTLAFTLRAGSDQRVCLEILDLRGRRVRLLLDEVLASGTQRVVWDGRDDAGAAVASATYVARLLAGGTVAGLQKLTLLK